MSAPAPRYGDYRDHLWQPRDPRTGARVWPLDFTRTSEAAEDRGRPLPTAPDRRVA